ncbi:MAG: undecaprenyl-diphosphate phosphatase [Akkermansiaceae bacterium]
MEIWQALLLGLIEGITEYLPVSSTGHLIVAQRLMHIGTESAVEKYAADAFAICIQGGAILAVLGLYYKHVIKMIKGVFGQDPEGLKLAIAVIVGFLPAAVFGLLLNDWIEAKLFGLWPVIAAWIIGGIGILWTVSWRKRNPPRGNGRDILRLAWQSALFIGFLQCVAMWPGTSRSLMTICGGLIVGLSVKAAVEYSFLLGVVTLSAATMKKAIWGVEGAGVKYDEWFGGFNLMLDQYGTTPLVAGLIAATVSAALAVKWLVTYLQSHGLQIFGYYRIAIGLVIGSLLLTGTL